MRMGEGGAAAEGDPRVSCGLPPLAAADEGEGDGMEEEEEEGDRAAAAAAAATT